MSTTDFIRELRLRQWARLHFVPAESRKSTWHPIVLDEMQCRDRELIHEALPVESVAGDQQTSLEIPLEITSRLPSADFADLGVVDGLANVADSLPDDSLAATVPSQFDQSYEPNVGARFVPLHPGEQWNLHTGTSDIPKPHTRAFVQGTFEPTDTSEAACFY